MVIKGLDERKRELTFNDLKKGDVFLYDGSVYMKGWSGVEYNAINLETGKITTFGCDVHYAVKRLNAELHILD